ncbi:MAG: hypothetical protein IGS48_17030 [Oscillatoriales cyanobacterium C42_A2020_001]|nr:hypothetical protein [Leptolyngbyaceae cyanobacterium C42_A2020_001]
MPTPFPDDSDAFAEAEDDPKAIAREDIARWLEQLRRSDRSLYNLMALEVWSIAQTMDGLIPGFWSRFMENRQIALKEFVEQRKKQQQAEEVTSEQVEPINPDPDSVD